jgi:hypothetical protein
LRNKLFATARWRTNADRSEKLLRESSEAADAISCSMLRCRWQSTTSREKIRWYVEIPDGVAAAKRRPCLFK